MGFRDDDRALYVSPYNNLHEVLYVSDDIVASWSSLWLKIILVYSPLRIWFYYEVLSLHAAPFNIIL